MYQIKSRTKCKDSNIIRVRKKSIKTEIEFKREQTIS